MFQVGQEHSAVGIAISNVVLARLSGGGQLV